MLDPGAARPRGADRSPCDRSPATRRREGSFAEIRLRPTSLLLAVWLLAGTPTLPQADDPPGSLPHLGTTRKHLREALLGHDTTGLAEAARDCVRLRAKGLRPLWDTLVALGEEEVGPRPAQPRPRRLEEEGTILRSLQEAFRQSNRPAVDRFLADASLEVRSTTHLGTRLAWARLIAGVDLPAAGYHLQRLLASETDWRPRAAVAERLAARSASRLPEELLHATEDPAWPVRRLALGAVVRTRAQEALPRLMALLDEADRPGREDVFDALRAVTGRSFGDRTDLWKRWWAGEIGVPETQGLAAPAVPSLGPVTGSAGTGFFGLPIRSRLALFLLDGSASMADVPRRITRSATGRFPDTKWTLVRAELHRALQGLPAGARFALAVYGETVHAWRAEMTPASPEALEEALAFADGFEPEGGTDMLGALEYAFDLAIATGSPREGPGVDTIFLLSDGLPTLGDLVRPEDLLEEVDRRNRILRLRIHTIAAGDQDRAFLSALAGRHGGTAVDLLPGRP